MEKKITKKENFATLTEIVANSSHPRKAELLGFIEHEVDLLSKKSSKTTMTATQKANLEVLEVIKEVLADGEAPMTVSEMIKDKRLSEYTNQKISALLRKLVEAGEVEKVTDKKVSRFALIDKD